MPDQEESKRVSGQVSILSTQLIETVDKLSKMEEQLLNAKKVVATQKATLDSYVAAKSSYESVEKELLTTKEQLNFLQNQLKIEKHSREIAQRDVERLNKEIQDLTESLFSEANNMVADARKEKHSIEILNLKLQGQLNEKDNLLLALNTQLKKLKSVMHDLENENHSLIKSNRDSIILNDGFTPSNSSIDKITTDSFSAALPCVQSNILFSPLAQRIRYDVSLYDEYLRFIAVLPICPTIKDTISHSKLITRLVNEEIQPILRLDNATGLGWMVKRNLMSLIINGLVVVEPISGINETYKVGYSSYSQSQNNGKFELKDNHLFNYPVNSPPVAISNPCAFCSESRDDILEHGRLYVLKTLQKMEHGVTETTNQFPLCYYCLVKIRQICKIFAFLRLLKEGVWNLEKVELIPISTQDASQSVNEPNKMEKKEKRKSKRLSFIENLSRTNSIQSISKIEGAPNYLDQNGLPVTNIQRSWVHLCTLRASLHWAHIGIWSLDDAVQVKMSSLCKEEGTSQNVSVSLSSDDKWVVNHNSDVEIQSFKERGERFDFESIGSPNETSNDHLDNHKEKIEFSKSIHMTDGEMHLCNEDENTQNQNPNNLTTNKIDISAVHDKSIEDVSIPQENAEPPHELREISLTIKSKKKAHTDQLFQNLDSLTAQFTEDNFSLENALENEDVNREILNV